MSARRQVQRTGRRRQVSRSQYPLLAPLTHRPVGVPTRSNAHHMKALFRDMLRDPGNKLLGRKYLKVLLVFAMSHGKTVQHLARVLYVNDLLFGKGVAHDILQIRTDNLWTTQLMIPVYQIVPQSFIRAAPNAQGLRLAALEGWSPPRIDFFIIF